MTKHQRRSAPVRRKFAKPIRLLHQSRCQAARVHRIWPDAEFHPRVVVEVRICRNAKRMAEAMRQQGWDHRTAVSSLRTDGMVLPFGSRFGDRPKLFRGSVLAHIFLRRKGVRERPGEVLSHECAHAAMRWAEHRGANLRRMAGEEVMCYALGRMVAQINRIGYAERLFV